MSAAELTRQIGQLPQNFNIKLKRGTITEKEMIQIADILGVGYEQTFMLQNGEKIKIKSIYDTKEQ